MHEPLLPGGLAQPRPASPLASLNPALRDLLILLSCGGPLVALSRAVERLDSALGWLGVPADASIDVRLHPTGSGWAATVHSPRTKGAPARNAVPLLPTVVGGGRQAWVTVRAGDSYRAWDGRACGEASELRARIVVLTTNQGVRNVALAVSALPGAAAGVKLSPVVAANDASEQLTPALMRLLGGA